ncbi:MAG: TRAP transporter substrate-binding protein [Pseudomonadota bacterium]
MKRRSFVKGAGVAGAAAAASTIAAPAIAKGKKKWVAVSAFGKAGLLGRAWDAFAAFVGEASEGKLTIKVYHANELVKPFESFDAVQEGTAQIGIGAPYYWTGKSNAIQFVAGMPFGLNAQEQNGWLYQAGGLEICNKIYNELGLQFLPCGNTGNQMGGWYNKEINTVDDLKGLKFRMPGLGGEILKTFGVNVILLPGTEVLPALTSGAIDGTEWIGPVADRGKGLFKVAKYYYYPGWHEPATVLDCFINKAEFDALDKASRAIVEHAAAKMNIMLLSQFQALNNAAMDALVNEEGVQVKKYSEELLKAIGGRAPQVLADVASKDKLSKEIYDHVVAYRKTSVNWARLSEGAFIESRDYAKL